MTFATLASFFEKLEKTSSRLTLIEILSQLFKVVQSEKEIEELIYLVQGRVAPFFAPIEIGMADKMVAQSIAQAYGITREDVWQEFDHLGDMGLAVMHFAKKHHDSQISVSEVFTILSEIAEIRGDGSVEKKITLLADLLKKIDPLSAKHLVRIPLGNLRLGIGDPTILDA